jgi:D-3-phosphoglycerate dehydrogenase
MTLGIVGKGRIGDEVIRRVQQERLFKDVLFSDVAQMPGNMPLADLLEASDVVSIHAGGKQEILTPDLLSHMKQDALLVNTARAGNVNRWGLLKQMQERGLWYATDVFWDESPDGFKDEVTKQIIDHPNFVPPTQHTAASDEVTQQQLSEEGAERTLAFATQGTVNGVASKLFPEIKLPKRMEPGSRFVITHESIPGQIEGITAVIARAQVSIARLFNEQGERQGDHQLAATILDLPSDVEMPQALQCLRTIKLELNALRARALWFSTAPQK